jgi:hypothetical protein
MTLEAKVFGGGAVISGMNSINVGERNTKFVLDYLATERIPVVSKDVLEIYPRKVCFLPAQRQGHGQAPGTDQYRGGGALERVRPRTPARTPTSAPAVRPTWLLSSLSHRHDETQRKRTMDKTRVVVVDDSALVRSLLTEIINRQPDMECVGSAATRWWPAR